MKLRADTLRIAVGGALAAAAVGAALVELPPGHAAALAGSGAYVALLLWELLRSRHRLAEEHAANLAKSAYLANMSHELRTPLNAIIGFSDMIREEMWQPGRPKHVEYAADIHASGSHLLDVLNDVLDLARIESGHFELKESEVDLSELVASCVRLLGEKARRGGLTLTVDIPPSDCLVRCDVSKMKQVLLNLTANAIKFTPKGGMVAVSARTDGRGLVIDVSDTGNGIPEKDIPKVLTPFYQSAHTRLVPNEGAGLGLPLARSLTELHGGTLRINSRPGWGTRVTVTLPGWRRVRTEAVGSVPALAVQEA